MLVPLDSDQEGLNAKKRLEADLFAADSSVVLLGSALAMTKATIEDLVERPRYVAALNNAGYAVTLDASELTAPCNVDAATSAFRRLGLGDFDHVAKTKAALQLVDAWSKDPSSVEQRTLSKATSLFMALKERFATTA